jgi:predicted phage terminase large subunit-like protein
LPVYLGVDLAISTKAEADYTAVVALSRGEDGTLYVLDVNRTRADFASVLRFIEAMAEKWKPVMIGIEQVQYQAAVVQELMRRTKLPIRGIRPDRDKITRFAPLEARYEQGQVVHVEGLPPYWQDELLSFPVGRHDDVVDAMAYAWQVIGQRKGWGAV